MASRRPLTAKNTDVPVKDQKQTKKESYPFRIMPRDDLVDNLKQVLIQSPCFSMHSVTEDDLKNPTSQKLQVLYLACLNALFGVLPDDFRQAAFEEHPVEHPDLHEESFGNMRLFYATQKMMETCLVKDFSINDIFNPTPRRTACHFSAIINFLKYHFSSYFTAGRVGELESEKQDLEQRYEESIARYDSLQAKYTELHTKRKEEQEREKELKGTINLQEQGLEVLRANQEALQKRYQTIASSKATKDKVLAEHKKELDKWMSRVEDLNRQIVPTPERLNAELAASREETEEMKDNVRRCEEQLRTGEFLTTTTRQVPPVIRSLDEDLGTLLTKAKRRDELQKRLEDTQESIGAQKQLLKESAAKYSNLAHHLKLIEEELSHLEYEPKPKHGDEQLHRDMLLLQQEIHQKPSVSAIQMEMEEKREQLKMKQASCTALRQNIERMHASLQSAYLKLKATADHEWLVE